MELRLVLVCLSLLCMSACRDSESISTEDPKSTSAPATLDTTQTAATPTATVKVLQYNVKQGKSGQDCCWGNPSVRPKQQALIVQELTSGGVELGSLIESDSGPAENWQCSDQDSLLGTHLPSFASHCTTCATSSSFKEATHLLWNQNKWTALAKYGDASADTCFAAGQTVFQGRGFAAVLLQSVDRPNDQVIFIGVHPGHAAQGFYAGAGPVVVAYQELAGKSNGDPRLIISGDFNLSCQDALTQIGQSNIAPGTLVQCPSPPTCCYDSSFSLDYDHVFTNWPKAQLTTAIAPSYTGPFTPAGSGRHRSEEHKPVVATLQLP